MSSSHEETKVSPEPSFSEAYNAGFEAGRRGGRRGEHAAVYRASAALERTFVDGVLDGMRRRYRRAR